ncbi:MAG: DUF1700 domain-containing protein [Lachnospiraceae bacterium]|nr:DUF1700 domain-containing protein [Lachnospiraceae bacterium]
MDKAAFLSELQNALEGEVSEIVINDTMNYYNQYIVNEVNAGNTEEDVIKRLGSGNVIAKTIIASEEAKNKNDSHAGYNAYGDDRTGRDNKGLHMSMDSSGNMDIKYGSFRLNSWYGKLLGLLIAILVIVLIFMVIAGLFSLLWTLFPIFLIGFLIITLINFLAGR